MGALEDRIAATEAKLKQLKTAQLKTEARKRAALSKRQRQDDTRRKFLAGAVLLARVENGQWPQAEFRAMMDQALTRSDDRALFDLSEQASASEISPALVE